MSWNPSKSELEVMRDNLTKQLTQAARDGKDVKPFQDALDDIDAAYGPPMDLPGSPMSQPVGKQVGTLEAAVSIFKIWWYSILIGLGVWFLVWLWR